MSNVVIGIDLGGTRIKAVAIDELGNILHHHYQPTNDGYDTIWKNAISIAVHDIQEKLKTNTTLYGISAPGLPNADNSAIAFMPGRLHGLENFDWTEFLKTRTFVLNDAIGNCSIEKRTSGKFSSTHQLLTAIRNGDNFATEVWLKSIKKLAIGLASITNILSPEMIILGGGITEAGNDLFKPLEKYMSMYE